MTKEEEFRARFPRICFLDPGDLPALADYLASGQRLAANETLLGAEKAGEGNMNCVVRVRTSGGTFILKESRPWLEKYPQIAVPLVETPAEHSTSHLRVAHGVGQAPEMFAGQLRVGMVKEHDFTSGQPGRLVHLDAAPRSATAHDPQARESGRGGVRLTAGRGDQDLIDQSVVQPPRGHFGGHRVLAFTRHDDADSHADGGDNVSILGALCLRGTPEPMCVNGATDGRVFLTFLRDVLLPQLWPGAVVVMDNPGAHQVKGARDLIEAAGARLLYLPPYSADFTRIEMAWSKLKNFLREIAARTTEALDRAIGEGWHAVSARDAFGFFKHCGYVGYLNRVVLQCLVRDELRSQMARCTLAAWPRFTR